MKKSRTVCILFDEPAEQELLTDFLDRFKYPYVVASNKGAALTELKKVASPVVLLEGDPQEHLRWLRSAKGSDHQVMVLLIALQEEEAWTHSPLIDHVVQPFDFVYLSNLLDLSKDESVQQRQNV